MYMGDRIVPELSFHARTKDACLPSPSAALPTLLSLAKRLQAEN
jgi:hypothetical protein